MRCNILYTCSNCCRHWDLLLSWCIYLGSTSIGEEGNGTLSRLMFRLPAFQPRDVGNRWSAVGDGNTR